MENREQSEGNKHPPHLVNDRGKPIQLDAENKQ